jgi:P27 family predicted phage terminase small subunit
MGHAKKPLAFVKLDGDPGKISSTVGLVVCPSWLSSTAKAEWKRVAPKLTKLDLLTSLDRSILAGYCAYYATRCKFDVILKEGGSTYVGVDGRERQRSEVRLLVDCIALMKRCCADYGMIPSPRGRMSFPGQKEPLDQMDEILDRPKKKRPIQRGISDSRKG